jgi:hypothetical protein
LKIELPVRSAVLKQDTGGLVVRWVTTSEYPLLYVFVFAFLFSYDGEGRCRKWIRDRRFVGRVVFS